MKNDPQIYLIGNAHLDPVWLWRWQEGFAEIKATFQSALERLEEFPEFIFSCAAACYYQWVEENAPEMFAAIQKRVAEGRWVIVGGWWVQPDCNIPAGESLARHGLYSQRYFQEKFGVTAKVGYNVDSFGHNGMLPQILQKSGMDYYVFMRPGDAEKDLPGNLFWWESPDGSRVLTFKIPFSYGQWTPWEGGSLERKMEETQGLAERQGIDLMGFYGVGNHGGGPTIANLQTLRRMRAGRGGARMVFGSPNAYFAAVERRGYQLPVVRDDLQHHASGCYAAHSEIKALNRRAEHRLMAAEKWATIAHCVMGLVYPQHRIRQAWQNVLFNQFHDIMGGCSIKEAYQDARESFGEALHGGATVLNAALQKISWAIDTMGPKKLPLSKESDWLLWEAHDQGAPLVVFNPHCWNITAPVQVNKQVRGITDETGQPVAVQKVRGSRTNQADKWDTLFMAELPALGYRVYWLHRETEFPERAAAQPLAASQNMLENEWFQLALEPHTGFIKRLYDKKQQTEVLAGPGAVPIVIDDFESDTWAHGIFEFRRETGRFGDAQITLAEQGPLRARLRAVSRYNQSVLRQDFILYRDRPLIEVRVRLDWRERHKLLKISFPVNVTGPHAVYEIPYGFMERPVDGLEQPGQQWLDVGGRLNQIDGAPYGLALLNDCKYSFDVKENDLRMTVARSAIYADHFGERDEFCELMDQGIQEFRYALIPHPGEWRETDLVRQAYEFNQSPFPIIETYHPGPLGLRMSGIGISAPNVTATVLKQAEDGGGYILRCYETAGLDTVARIRLPLLGREWEARFKRCEIKTFRIPPEGEIEELNLLEMG